MAKVKKGDKVKVGKRSCKVTSVGAGGFSVNCGPPSGKKRRGKRKSRKSSRRGSRGLGAVRGGPTCGIPSGLLSRLPNKAAEALKEACLDAQGGVDALMEKIRKGKKPGASMIDKAAMHAAHKMLKANEAYTKKTIAQEKKIYRNAAFDRFYAAEAAKPKPGKKAAEIYSRSDPRFDAGLAGVRRRKSRKGRKSRR